MRVRGRPRRSAWSTRSWTPPTRCWTPPGPGSRPTPTPSSPGTSRGTRSPAVPRTRPALATNLPAYPANLRKRLKGAPMPAPKAIMAAAVEGSLVDVDTALRIETQYFVSLVTGPVAKNMMKAFFVDMQQITRGAARPKDQPSWRPQRAAVMGAGMMGAGIAYVLAKAGVDVLLKDVTTEAAARGKAHAEKLLATAVGRGRSTQEAADALLARITPTADVDRARRLRPDDRGGLRGPGAEAPASTARPSRCWTATRCSPRTPPRCRSPRLAGGVSRPAGLHRPALLLPGRQDAAGRDRGRRADRRRRRWPGRSTWSS